jgi:hypothetical protein
MANAKRLKHAYYTPEEAGSLGGARALVRSVGANRAKKRRDVGGWLSGQDAYTLHKQARTKFRRRPTIVRGVGVQLQADLMDVKSHREDNGGATFLLVAVDVFSRKLYVRPLTSKSGGVVSKALDSVLEDAGGISALQTDKGTEFLNRDVAAVLRRRNIKHFTSENESIKASLVERVNRTLRGKIHRRLTATKGNRYVDVLPALVRSYNNTPHTSIGMAPSRVNYKNQERVWSKLYEPDMSGNDSRHAEKPTFARGDNVRISKARGAFERGYTPNWSREIFVVERVDADAKPIVYELKDLADEPVLGGFYRQQLQKVKLPRAFEIEEVVRTEGKGRSKKLFVKWLGYPKSFNSWIAAGDVAQERGASRR